MESATSIIHAIAGAPAFDGCCDTPEDARCWLCAHRTSRGIDRMRWQGANFQNQNTCRDQGSPYVCEPCAWACSWVPPPGIVTPPGKKGVNLRLYSHFWHDGEYRYWNKASKPAMREWLRAPKSGPWFAAIADSGQKHVLSWTPINIGPRGIARFEERNVGLPDAGGWAIVDDMTALLSRGVTKDELDRATYRPKLLAQYAPECRAFENKWSRDRGGAWWALALWLSQRDEEEYGRRQGEAIGSRAGARSARDKRASDVGPDAVAAKGRGKAQSNNRGVRDDSAAGHALGNAQGSLFGDM